MGLGWSIAPWSLVMGEKRGKNKQIIINVFLHLLYLSLSSASTCRWIVHGDEAVVESQDRVGSEIVTSLAQNAVLGSKRSSVAGSVWPQGFIILRANIPSLASTYHLFSSQGRSCRLSEHNKHGVPG